MFIQSPPENHLNLLQQFLLAYTPPADGQMATPAEAVRLVEHPEMRFSLSMLLARSSELLKELRSQQ